MIISALITPINPTPVSYIYPVEVPIEIKEKEITLDTETNTLCNCYLYSELYTGINLPQMATIQPNTSDPLVGSIAIMQYGDIKHVAVVTEVTESSFSVTEANYKHCEKTERTLAYNYKRLVGFFTPG